MPTPTEILEQLRDRMTDLPRRLADVLRQTPAGIARPSGLNAERPEGARDRFGATANLLGAAGQFSAPLAHAAQIMAGIKNLMDAWHDFQAAWGMNRAAGASPPGPVVRVIPPAALPALGAPPAPPPTTRAPGLPGLPPGSPLPRALPSLPAPPMPLRPPAPTVLPPGSVPASAVPVRSWAGAPPLPAPPLPAQRLPSLGLPAAPAMPQALTAPALPPAPLPPRRPEGTAPPLPAPPLPRPQLKGPDAPALMPPPIAPLALSFSGTAPPLPAAPEVGREWPALPAPRGMCPLALPSSPVRPRGLQPAGLGAPGLHGGAGRERGPMAELLGALIGSPLPSGPVGAGQDGNREMLELLRKIDSRLEQLVGQGHERDTGQLPPDSPGPAPAAGAQHLPPAVRETVARGRVTERSGPTGEKVDKAIDFARRLGNALKVAEMLG